jgi:hypothetical protein
LRELTLTLKVQAVAGAVWVSMLNDQVQVPEAQTRFMFSIVHSGCAAAIMETAPDWRSTRFSAFGAGAARATLERIVATMIPVSFILAIRVGYCVETSIDRRLAMKVMVTRIPARELFLIYIPYSHA